MNIHDYIDDPLQPRHYNLADRPPERYPGDDEDATEVNDEDAEFDDDDDVDDADEDEEDEERLDDE